MTVQGFLVGLTSGVLIWLALIPMDWKRSLGASELQIVKWFLVLRAMMPLVFNFVGQRADRFFTGGWDAGGYHSRGLRVAEQMDGGQTVQAHAQVPGTGAIDLATGYFYLFAGPDRLAAAYLSTFVSTVGILLFWLATRHLVGNQQKWYALVVLFAPTTMWWSANIGKEPPLLLGLGAGMMALSLFLRGMQPIRAVSYLVVAIGIMGFVRPHVAVLFGLSVLIGVLIGSRRLDSSRRKIGRGRKFVAALAGLVALLVAAPLTAQLLGAGDGESLVEAAYDRAELTAEGQGRSSYEAEPVTSPTQVPEAMVTVLFRPFVWEAFTPLQFLAALEGLVVFVALGWRVIQMIQKRATLLMSPLVTTAMLYAALFCSATVTYGNFGLIVRQKMQVWPFVIFVLFAIVPLTAGRTRRSLAQPYERRAAQRPFSNSIRLNLANPN